MDSILTYVNSDTAAKQSERHESTTCARATQKCTLNQDSDAYDCSQNLAQSTTFANEKAMDIIFKPLLAVVEQASLGDQKTKCTTPRRNQQIQPQSPPCIWEERRRAWQTHDESRTNFDRSEISKNLFNTQSCAVDAKTPLWSVLNFESDSEASMSNSMPTSPNICDTKFRRSPDTPTTAWSAINFDSQVEASMPGSKYLSEFPRCERGTDSRKRRLALGMLDNERSPMTPEKKKRLRHGHRKSPPNSFLHRIRNFRRVPGECKKRLFSP